MDAEQIIQAAHGVAALRPSQQTKRPERGSSAWRDIERIKEQAQLVEEVRRSLPGVATEAAAIAWLDNNCPAWRLGPAPRGKPLFVEKLEDNDGD